LASIIINLNRNFFSAASENSKSNIEEGGTEESQEGGGKGEDKGAREKIIIFTYAVFSRIFTKICSYSENFEAVRVLAFDLAISSFEAEGGFQEQSEGRRGETRGRTRGVVAFIEEAERAWPTVFSSAGMLLYPFLPPSLPLLPPFLSFPFLSLHPLLVSFCL
jgi:hypothetical protein